MTEQNSIVQQPSSLAEHKTRASTVEKLFANNDIVLAAGLAMILATLLLPLPTFLMDLLLSVSIGVALSALVIVLSANESLEFSTFPSMLLFLTLFRLSLNVASTRLILLHGDAGEIIHTFGEFVVGGNLVVGLVVFLILVIIQFVVITKGSERISEVSARFNLDAMPGKQMAIDADLNAGLIGDIEAKERRAKIVKESEFYGAMDGASKFIRGDAVAGLIITAINLVGGFAVGMMQGMSAGDSIQTYAILAVGDGLVSQIPALIISTSSGFLISKTSTDNSLGQDLAGQFLAKGRPLAIAAGLLAAMVFVPGFPKLPFASLAIGAGLLARMLGKDKAAKAAEVAQAEAREKPEDEEASVEELLDVDRIAIQVGPRLVRLVDPRRKGSLSHRIKPLRRKFAQQYGLVLPLVRLRDNVTLDPTAYEICLHNHVVAAGKLEPDRLMAMDPGTVQTPIKGAPAQEPVFNLPALWITEEQKSEAEMRGYTVVDPETILVTHLSETLRRHAEEVLSRDDVQQLIDRLRERQPTLVNTVVGEAVPLSLLHRVLQNLLADGIPIRDLGLILEALGEHAGKTRDASLLTEVARKSLVRTITEQHSDADGKITALVIDPASEYELRNSIGREGESEVLAIGPERALEFVNRVADVWKAAMEQGYDKAVLLCDYRVRPHLAAMLARQVPQLSVVAYDEIAVATNIESVGTVSLAGTEDEPAAMGGQLQPAGA
jgi:flagellar biosynthesis protein FlhA